MPAEPTLQEIQAFAKTLDRSVVAEELLRLKYHLDHVGDITGANSRTAALAALLGLIKFVTRAIPGCQAPPPGLTLLHQALSDLDDGKVHPLLKPAGAQGQPVSSERRILSGCAAAVMDCLIQSGFKPNEAARIVGRELSKLKIKFGDQRQAKIETSIKNWRWRAMGGNPENDLDASVYRELRSAFKCSGDRDLDRKNLVRVLLDSLRKLGLVA
jgi:hypothetical protein